MSYEDLFCEGTEQRGVMFLGDSATAHFHIPPSWLTANGWHGLTGLKDPLVKILYIHTIPPTLLYSPLISHLIMIYVCDF